MDPTNVVCMCKGMLLDHKNEVEKKKKDHEALIRATVWMSLDNVQNEEPHIVDSIYNGRPRIGNLKRPVVS